MNELTYGASVIDACVHLRPYGYTIHKTIESGQCGHLTKHNGLRLWCPTSLDQFQGLTFYIFLVFIVRKSLDDISAEILARKYEPGTYIYR